MYFIFDSLFVYFLLTVWPEIWGSVPEALHALNVHHRWYHWPITYLITEAGALYIFCHFVHVHVEFFGVYSWSSHALSTYWRSRHSTSTLPPSSWPKTWPFSHPLSMILFSREPLRRFGAINNRQTLPLQSRCIANVNCHATNMFVTIVTCYIFRPVFFICLFICLALFRDVHRSIFRSALTTSLSVLAYDSPERQVCQMPSYSFFGEFLRGRSLSSSLGLQPTRFVVIRGYTHV